MLFQLLGCSSAKFSGDNQASPPSTVPVYPNQVTTSNAAAGSQSQPPIIGDDCLSSAQSQIFSCDNIREARGGLIDELVGIKLVLLNTKLPLFAGEAACRGRGGELIAENDLMVQKIMNCILPEDWWEDNSSDLIYKRISMASIQNKFGQSVANACLGQQTSSNIATIPGGSPHDPSMPMDIYCVFAL